MLSGKPYDTPELRELRERQRRLLAGSGLNPKAIEGLPETIDPVKAAASEIALRRTAEAILADTDGLAEHIEARARGTELELALAVIRERDGWDQRIVTRIENEQENPRPQYSQPPKLEDLLKDWALLVHLADALAAHAEF